MQHPIAELGDFIREILEFCYSDQHRESLRAKAKVDGMTMEQMVAAALAQRISEQFEVQRKNLN